MKQYQLKLPGSLPVKQTISVSVVMIIYAVGVAGMINPLTNGLFIRLIPAVILLSLAVSLGFHQQYDKRTIAVFLLVAVVAWVIEAAGVNTGMIFGRYSYGPSLGIRYYGTPVIIGLNWLLLIYGTAALAGNLRISNIYKILISSLFMVAFDAVLETLAPLMNMWRFEDGTAPLRNYVAWFFISILLHSFLRLAGIKINNIVARIVLFVQFAFFLLVAILLHFTS